MCKIRPKFMAYLVNGGLRIERSPYIKNDRKIFFMDHLVWTYSVEMESGIIQEIFSHPERHLIADYDKPEVQDAVELWCDGVFNYIKDSKQKAPDIKSKAL